jgi:NAD(P)-dependent dehydrogenase (short-subunit alcohol dehydrogenase family)
LAVTRAVLPTMRRQRSGHIINMSSLGGYAALGGWGVYGASKFAVEGISAALAAELAPLGIKATVIEPGFFRTDLLDAQSMQSAAQIEDYAQTVGVTRARAVDLNHAQPGDPAKLADAIIVLARQADPPKRLRLGSDALARIVGKNREVDAEAARWHDLSVSTDA